MIGTHNSYHVEPGPVMQALIRGSRPAEADALMYSHRPLREQFGLLGVRQIELDVFADPEGGRYAAPRGPLLARAAGLPGVPAHDPEGALQRPGLKVLHVQDIDFLSRNLTFRGALEEIRDWSAANPFHFPILVLVELKEDAPGPEFTAALPFDEPALAALDAEIREVIPARQRFEPDQLRGGRPTLREVVAGKGWPEVSSLLGKILFAMDNEGAVLERYLGTSQNLAGRVMFVSVGPEHPAAAWMKRNDAVGDFEVIASLVRQGFLVRTRADVGTAEARTNDGKRRERALASGAQFVSTDYPEPDPRLSPYVVRLAGGMVARANPVSGVDLPGWADMEQLARRTAAIQNALGEAAHQRRRLAEASEHYGTALELDPPSEGTAGDLALARRWAPELRVHREEPFGLRDVAVVIHPERPWIAYHLFWEDDIDFPDDNDPCDHEVIWVECGAGFDRAVAVHTYFHGRILTRRLAAGEPVRVAVEWGKHGSLPVNGEGRLAEEPASLREHWRRLRETGRRQADHPLGRGWPERFEGGYGEYAAFDRSLVLADRLGAERQVIRSRWPNAVLNRWMIPYNFAAKTRWPVE